MQFIKIISHNKKISYNINVWQQTACLMFNLITVGNFTSSLICMPAGRTKLSDGSDLKTYLKMRSFGHDALAVVIPNGV